MTDGDGLMEAVTGETNQRTVPAIDVCPCD